MTLSTDRISEISGAPTLLDVAAPACSGREGEIFSRAERTLPPARAAALATLCANRGWRHDTPLVAAWMLVMDRVLAGESATLHEWRGDSSHPVTFSASLASFATGEAWMAHVDGLRAQARAVDTAYDCLWSCGPADEALAALPDAPLRIGVDPVTARIDAQFREAIFAPDMIGALLDCLVHVAAALIDDPAIALPSLDVLTPGQHARLAALNPPLAAFTPPSVPAVFDRIAHESPQRDALVWQGGRLSYGTLAARSSAIAAELLARGLGAGKVVAVALERSPDAIVAILAILKAGAAYLPIDLAFPAARIAFMLEDAAADAVVAASGDAARLPPAIPILDVAAWPNATAVAALPPVAADAVAYVMYTSGSTGEPKGIEIRHQSIVHLVRDVGYMRLDASVAFLHAAPLGFDASTLEIWGPLLNGGRCVLHDESIPTGPGVARAIATHGVNAAWLTAALFNAIVDDDPAHLRGLAQLLAGGEALSVAHVAKALAALPGTTLINGYGPTECTTFTATFTVPPDLPVGTRSIPIGQPIAQTSCHVLNNRLQALPPGVPGELCVGGPGLARGYLRRPALTTARFVVDATGRRLYRSGDLVRHLADGNLEFIGRHDGQVKIRGFRIETGEIENALARLAGVKACAVTARADHPAGARLVAYVVPADAAPSIPDLRAGLAAVLPDFMVPAAFVLLPALPLTTNGKLDRRALPVPENRRPDITATYQAPESDAEAKVCAIFADVLGLDRAGRQDNFFELGGNSLLVMQALARLRGALGTQIPATVFFSNPTPAAIAATLADRGGTPRARAASRTNIAASAREPIAIIGMSGRFPGAQDVDAFWENLCAGRDSVTRFTDADLDPSIPAALRADPAYVRARGVIDGVDMFDAAFFGISPREAELMDPQQRIFLELCWECLERGGYVPDACESPVGVFAGMYNATYFQRHVVAHPERVAQLGEFQVMLANEKDYIATRVAHRLDLTGPAVSVHTACSTSLVAIAQAMASLREGQCDMALAGGVSITCPPRSGYLYQEGAMLSPDGVTRTFDRDARGTIFSDGGAVVLLKRLADALADGDTIHAVLRGAAVNNDGGAKASFTAPSVDGQAAVIAAALDAAAVNAREIDYVEAHGTATPLGDPVELAALTKAFRRHTPDTGFCRIGSVKSNVGHLVIAAGATGVIKTALALAHERLPASLHFQAPNPEIDFAASPFVVNAESQAWKRQSRPRRAGVSSFGVGGTNAHVILEEAPAASASADNVVVNGPQLLCWSARTANALATAGNRLAAHLEAHVDANLADVAHTLRVARKAFAQRACAVVASAREAVATLSAADAPWRAAGQTGETPPGVIFMFPGQGAQYASMGQTLYENEPAFRNAMDACLAAMRGVLDFDLKAKMFSDDADALVATAVTQPALFCVEYALARWWMALGLVPRALIGHSVGEYVAATIAGVFDLNDAARLVARRGALMQSMPPGAMLSVRAPLAVVTPMLSADLALAAENSPGLCVIAGEREAIETLKMCLDADKIVSRPLQTSHAFHSPMMDPAVAPFQAAFAGVSLSPPRIPIQSTVTGRVLTASEACDPGYWARHLREPVRFSPAFLALAEHSPGLFLEVGPRATLTTLARQHAAPPRLNHRPAAPAIASLADTADSEHRSLLLAAGRLWTQGVDLALTALDRRTVKRRIPLPTYPFERRRFWLDAALPAQPASAPAPSTPPMAPASVSTLAMPFPSSHVTSNPTEASMNNMRTSLDRKPALVSQLRAILEDTSGVDMSEADTGTLFVELGLDSLSLTQIAIQLKQAFKINVTFRQLMENYRSLDALAAHLDAEMPADAIPASATQASLPLAATSTVPLAAPSMAMVTATTGSLVEQVIRQQMQLMAQQLALLQGGAAPLAAPGVAPMASTAPVSPLSPAPAAAPAATATTATTATTEKAAPAAVNDEDAAGSLSKYDVKKAFGAIARIHTDAGGELTERQRTRLETFIRRYVARTRKSKEYTAEHRPHLADPRVVNGFRPAIKEIIYQIVIGKSRGARMWDIDGNEYVDVLNGFGMNLFGWQPPFVTEAARRQLEEGYEIGPQHPLAGEVARLICEMTGFDRAGLCNTGSEAVMGAIRIARTVTGRNTIALFTGSYHGIFDEVIVRATRKLRAVPAAPGIMPSTAQNVLVLDYGTPESMEIIKSRAHELAAVLVEPVQSRRPDFQPKEFLHELRKVTQDAGTLLVLDEVVTGFRCHPGGIQALFDIRADLCTYGKVVGGGFPIGVIAGKREFMDALDGGAWQYGDDSIPTVGVTYFAGTFVRHPLALAAAKAVLDHLKQQGPELQAALTRTTAAMVDELNAYCREMGAPIVLKSFASVWKTFFTEEHPLQDLLFAMMRSRGIHILDNFPCFFTTAHGAEDVALIKTAFKESVHELQESGFIPRRADARAVALDASRPPMPGARIGKDPDGKPAWFVPNPDSPGKYLRLDA